MEIFRGLLGPSLLAGLISCGSACQCLAQPRSASSDVSATPRPALVERHKKIAEMHSKMATCLASQKTAAECQVEMKAACTSSLGGECPMGRGMGAMRGRGMMNGGQCPGWMMYEEPGRGND